MSHEVLKKLQSGFHVWGVIAAAAAAEASMLAVDVDVDIGVELVVDAVRLVLSFA